MRWRDVSTDAWGYFACMTLLAMVPHVILVVVILLILN